MKNKVPKLRFPEFSGEWKEKSLENITDYVDYRGKTPTKTESGIFLVTAKNIKMGYIDYETSKEFISEESYNEAMRRGLPKIGDVLFTTEAPMGNIAQVDNENIALAQRVIKFRGKSILNNTFLKYSFINDKFQNELLNNAIGTTVLGIQGKVLHKMKINFPSLPEQEKIASFLSKVDESIEILEEEKELWEKYKKGMMQKIFSQKLRFKDENGSDYPEWKEKRLGEVCNIIMGQSPSSLAYNENFEGLPLVQGNADCKKRKIIPRIYSSEITKESLPKDIIMSVRAPAGTIAKSDIHSCIGRGVCAIRSKIENQEYIYQYLINYEDEWSKYSQGSTFDSINSNDVKGLCIPLPSLPEQEKIANFLSSIDEKIELIEKELEGVKEFKKGLLQQMFI